VISLSQATSTQTASSALLPNTGKSFSGLRLLLLGLLLPVLGYWLLPALGIGAFSQLFDFKKSLLLFGGTIGLIGYFYYMRLVMPRPQVLVAFTLLAWPLVDYVNNLLLNQVGLNIHLRPLLFAALAFPSLWISLKNGRLLLRTIPWLKYYLFFFLWMLLYAFIFNGNAVDPRLAGGEESFSEGSVSFVQLTSYFYCLMAITVPAVAILRVRDHHGLFDTLNKALLWISSLEALLTIGGYPFGMFNMLLDGFTRAMGLFTHPNPFAHHMGILMVYLLGLFCYYQGERKHRIPGWLLFGGLGINFIAFLLGLSKTALAVFAVCAAIIALMNLAVPAVRRSFLHIAIALIVLVPLGLLGFQALSGESFFSLLESRIDQTQSLTWRTQIWQDLLADINGVSILTGHGFTAANATVFRLSFNDSKNAQPLMMVHNAYIGLLYDLGLMGYLMFVAALSMIFNAVRGWINAGKTRFGDVFGGKTMWRTEHSILIALAVYFLATCAFDEMSYMFDAPILFWALASLLYGVQWRDQQAAARRNAAVLPSALMAIHP
jgi:O-antigen ligase